MGVEIGGAKHEEHRRELLLLARLYKNQSAVNNSGFGSGVKRHVQ